MRRAFPRHVGAGVTVAREAIELSTEISERVERTAWRPEGQCRASLALGHPRWDDGARSVGRRADEHDLAPAQLAVHDRELLPVVRVPTVVDLDGLPDTGRMERDLF